MAPRFRRQRPDKITAPETFSNPIADGIYHALRPLDAAASRMEEKWGVDRLPDLVTPETASRFGMAKAKLDAALEADDVAAVVHRASVMMRGWDALDVEATAAGHQPVDVVAWLWRDDDDVPHAFVRDASDAIRYGKANTGVRCWTMGEIVRVAAAAEERSSLVGRVKETWPGAEVTADRPKSGDLNDELPF